MGPKLFGLPVLLALAYVGMGYLSWVVSLLILEGQNEALSGGLIILLPVLASLVMTIWDFSMDPVWADIDRGWVWRDGGRYYGVPISNFFGWFLTVYVFYQLFAVYVRNRETVGLAARDWRIAILFYAASAVGNLLAIAPSSVGSVFIDASGKVWVISDILRMSRMVSMFLMVPLCVIAWARVGRDGQRSFE